MFDTENGRNAHVRQALACKWWYTFSKSRAVEEPSDSDMPLDEPGSQLEDFGGVAYEYEEANDLFHWMDAAMDVGLGEAGPGPATVQATRGFKKMVASIPHSLDLQEDPMYFESHAKGGKVIRMSQTLYEKWEERFKEDDDEPGDEAAATYFPFASQLDWQIARWAVKENIGHGTLDRLLAIPGVRERLEVSYKNSRKLHQIVDSIPARANAWKSKAFRFSDGPEDETFSVRYRDPLEAVKALW
ncbi:hypothetical protein PQX77_003078, partial [Marasmius sp. AFHP31]